jgi:hypothetical protein
LWNSLPITLKESKRLEHFKRYNKIYSLRNESEISLLDVIVLKRYIALVLTSDNHHLARKSFGVCHIDRTSSVAK